MRKAYVDGPFGQIHVQIWGGGSTTMVRTDADGCPPPLICLPPAPYSSVALNTLAPLLADERTVIGLDYPGHGGSESGSRPASIEDYAAAAACVARTLSPDRPVNLFGFHSGCLVAVETAISHPDCVDKLVLVDIPFFDTETRAKFCEQTPNPVAISQDFEMLQSAWEFSVTQRLNQMTVARGYELFSDHIRLGASMNIAYHAAFGYDVDSRFPTTPKETLIVATQSGLLDGTRTAANAIPQSTLLEVLDITSGVIENSAAKLVEAMQAEFRLKNI